MSRIEEGGVAAITTAIVSRLTFYNLSITKRSVKSAIFYFSTICLTYLLIASISSSFFLSNPLLSTIHGQQEFDSTPPVLTVPDDIVVEATSEQGAEVTYTVTAQDDVGVTTTLEEDGTITTQDDVGLVITISCDPSSGSMFPIDETEVECRATDAAGIIGNGTFLITVEDTTPPVITVPQQITEEAISPDGATVSFEISAEDDVDGSATLNADGTITQDEVGGDIAISCTPASGSTLQLGTTEVTCNAEDSRRNTAEAGSFTIRVDGAADGEVIQPPGGEVIQPPGGEVIQPPGGEERQIGIVWVILFIVLVSIVIGGIALAKYKMNQRSSRRIKIPPSAIVEIKTKGGMSE